MEIRPIRTDKDHRAALAEINTSWGALEGTEESDKFDVLLALVEIYEAKRWPIDIDESFDPIDVLNYAIEELAAARPIRYHDINHVPYHELAMAQFIVRHLEDDVKARLKRRAAHHGRSMEEEVRHILRDAVKEQNQRVAKLGSRIAARFAKAGLTTELPELRGQVPLSAKFGK